MKQFRLWLVLGLAFILRIIFLGTFPQGFTPDEASQGYAAYSLLKTGKDEWGISWPVTSFRAFADYRAPLQTYLIIPSVAVFGLNEFAVRLPSAIVGTLAVLAVFLLVGRLFPDRKKVALLSAIFLAISPWHIQFSRTALEANFASLLFPLGLYFLLKGMKNDMSSLVWSAIIFGINLYSYLAAKLFIPLFLFFFLILNFNKIKINLKKYLFFVLVILVFALPIFTDTLFGPGNVRGKDLIITNFSRENLETISREQYFSKLNHFSPALTRLFSNKATFTVGQFITNYISYLSPTFWFTEGGREITYSVFPGFGLLHLFMFPLLFYGLYMLIKINHPAKKIIFLWLLLGIIPAAITKDGYRPNRAGSLLTLLEIISAFGFYELMKIVPKKMKTATSLISTIIIGISVFFYLNLYFFVSPVKYPQALSFGYRELLGKVTKIASNYQKIIFDRGNQSQVFVAFYSAMNPAEYQKYSQRWWPVIEKQNLLFLDMMNNYSLDKYIFKSFDASADLVPGNLVIIRAEKLDPNLSADILDQVNYPDNTPVFYLLSYVEK